MLSQLDFTIRPFSEGRFSALLKLEIFLRDGGEHLLQADLLRGERAIVVSFLDEGCRGLNSLDFSEQNRVPRSLLPCALKLMYLEPVLLEASLGAVLCSVDLALRTSVERDKLLVKLLALLNVGVWVVDAVLLVLPNVLQRALVILALTDMDHFVRWRVWDTVPNLA